jgi:hypothetical protein
VIGVEATYHAIVPALTKEEYMNSIPYNDLESLSLRDLLLILCVTHLLLEDEGKATPQDTREAVLVMAFANRAYGNEFFVELMEAVDHIRQNKQLRQWVAAAQPTRLEQYTN